MFTGLSCEFLAVDFFVVFSLADVTFATELCSIESASASSSSSSSSSSNSYSSFLFDEFVGDSTTASSSRWWCFLCFLRFLCFRCLHNSSPHFCLCLWRFTLGSSVEDCNDSCRNLSLRNFLRRRRSLIRTKWNRSWVLYESSRFKLKIRNRSYLFASFPSRVCSCVLASPTKLKQFALVEGSAALTVSACSVLLWPVLCLRCLPNDNGFGSYSIGYKTFESHVQNETKNIKKRKTINENALGTSRVTGHLHTYRQSDNH